MTHFAHPPSQPQPQKNRGWLYGCLGCGGAALLVLLLGVGCMAIVSTGDTGNTSGGNTSGGGTEQAAETGGDDGGQAPAAKIGDTVESGAFAFTVTDVETGVTTVGDNPYLKEKANGQFVIVHVTVENIGDESGLFDSSSQKLLDAEGKEYSSDTAAELALGEGQTFLEEINPGNKVEGQLVFDIPADVKPTHIVLHDFLSFDQGAKVALS